MVKRADLQSAKSYILQITRERAEKMIPDISLRILFGNLINERDSKHYMAEAWASKDGIRGMIVYDSSLIKSNVYNIKSSVFSALSIHELCHIKHMSSEHVDDVRRYHDRPKYFECVENHGEKWMANPTIHPERKSLRAYLGSEDMLVPDNILNIVQYTCGSCGHSGLFDTVYRKKKISKCENCKSKVIISKKLSPFEVYKISKLYEIDIIHDSVGIII